MLRIRAGETNFDPDFLLEYPLVGDSAIKSPTPNKAFITVLDEELLPWSADVPWLDYFLNSVWQIAEVDVTTGEVEILDALPNTATLFGYETDGRVFLSVREPLPGNEFQNRRVRILEATPGGNFEQVYECGACAFVQEFERLL